MPPGLTDHDRPGAPLPDLSPEARRKEALKHKAGLTEHVTRHVGPGSRAYDVASRALIGVWRDGFIHAGNLAYMTVLAIFPFFITGAALFSLLGERGERAAAINAILIALPPVVGAVIRPVALSVIEQSSGWLLWVGGLVGLWTVGSLIETIRDILRRAYGTRATQAFWWYRLLSSGIIVGAVVLVMLSLIAQVIIGTAQQVIEVYVPRLYDALDELALARFVPALVLYASVYLLFYSLTPAAYRKRRYPKWPGALLVAVWWAAVTAALPPLLHSVFHYDATYGSLAGIMIVLFFFWLVGLGMVMGAELNAALAVTPEEEEDRIGQSDNRARVAKTKANDREGRQPMTSPANGLMQGKRGLIMGLANEKSLAWGIAQKLADHGAELAFSYQGEALEKRVRPLAAQLGQDFCFECDVSQMDALDAAFDTLKARWETIDFLVHAIGFSDKTELRGKYVDTSLENFLMTLNISAYSLVAVTNRARPMMPNGGSVLTLTYYGAEKVVPHYNVMGVAKAALEASVKYLANDLGPENIRVNAISAGPIKTLAASGIGDFRYILKWNELNAPLRRNVTIEDVGGAGLYMLSDLSSGVTGEVHHVDAGYHLVGMKQEDAPDISLA